MSDMLFSTLLWNDFLKSGGDNGSARPNDGDRLDGRQLQLLSSVRVELSVEVSRLSLTLGDLLELSNGTRLDLQLQEELPVVLSIDSVPIANGRIVFDGSEPAVEITDLYEQEKNPGNKKPETGEQ